jgi:hypothetical protein
MTVCSQLETSARATLRLMGVDIHLIQLNDETIVSEADD